MRELKEKASQLSEPSGVSISLTALPANQMQIGRERWPALAGNGAE